MLPTGRPLHTPSRRRVERVDDAACDDAVFAREMQLLAFTHFNEVEVGNSAHITYFAAIHRSRHLLP